MKRLGGGVRSFIVAFLGLVVFTTVVRYSPTPAPSFGFTFSATDAQYLGEDPLTTYRDALHDLHPSVVRLPVYWNRIAPGATERHWDELDALMRASADAHAAVTLAIGAKVPRYPECYVPDWVTAQSPEQQAASLQAFLTEVVTRYRTHSALARWQVENEVLYPFGRCNSVQPAAVAREVALVRQLDPQHPITLTVSGEQQLWATVAKQADVIGTSVYRTATNPFIGVMVFPWGPLMYRLQAWSISPFASTVISELQAEPWFTIGARDVPLSLAAAQFTPHDLQRNTVFAIQTGVPEISFWGVEWWYYLRLHGHPELWDEAQRIMNP